LFARYLRDILDEALASGRTELVHAAVVGAERRGPVWRLELDDGTSLETQAVALAIGNQEPEPLGAFAEAGKRFIANPWGAEARAAVEQLAQSGGAALLIGTGLTMVDLVLSLDAAGHRGRIVALSRRGQVPRAHADFDPAPVDSTEVPKGKVAALWRWLRKRSAEVGWRAAIDSLRPHSATLWHSLGVEEQRRFLRHARPWWDVHRHRIAPDVAATVTRMVAEGRLEVIAGRILAARERGSALDVEFRRRGASKVQRMAFDFAFNCTGPLHSIGRTRDRLLRSLLDSGAARPDALGIGLEVDSRSRVAGVDRLWALGPLTKGRYWEIIAVPDIREQAAAVADDIERELRP
jgi:uncharacterized NAD(P)/FAD-binding protein YdhS